MSNENEKIIKNLSFKGTILEDKNIDELFNLVSCLSVKKEYLKILKPITNDIFVLMKENLEIFLKNNPNKLTPEDIKLIEKFTTKKKGGKPSRIKPSRIKPSRIKRKNGKERKIYTKKYKGGLTEGEVVEEILYMISISTDASTVIGLFIILMLFVGICMSRVERPASHP